MSIVQLGLLFAISAPFAFAVRIVFSRRRRILTVGSADQHEIDGPLGSGSTRFGSDIELSEVAREVRAAADAVYGLACACFVGIDLAVEEKIGLRTDPTVLRTVLRSTIESAVRATPGGHVLVTAHIVGTQIHIRIIDDGPNADWRSREIQLLEPVELLTVQRGSLAVEARPGRGTAVTIRLPLTAGPRAEANDPRAMHMLVEEEA
jgi:signal transduction histidine kinase